MTTIDLSGIPDKYVSRVVAYVDRVRSAATAEAEAGNLDRGEAEAFAEAASTFAGATIGIRGVIESAFYLESLPTTGWAEGAYRLRGKPSPLAQKEAS